MTEDECEYQTLSSERHDLYDNSMATVQSAKRKLLIVGVVAGVVIFSLIIAVIVLAVQKADLESEQEHQPPPAADKLRLDLLSHFSLKDGLDVKWLSGIKNSGDIDLARTGKYNILNVKVIRNASDVPIIEGASLTLRGFLETVHSDNFVVNLYLTSDNVTQDVIEELQRMKYTKPVLLSVPILPLKDGQFNLTGFIETLNRSDMATPFGVNLDLTSTCCDDAIGVGLLEFVAFIVKSSNFLVTLEIDAAVIARSWTELKWLLDTVDDVRLIISANNDWSTAIKYDLALARNDGDIRRIFYNMGKVRRDEFVTLASTMGSPLIYFNVEPRDAGSIIWSHNTDTWELLNNATKGDTMMIEGDIRVDNNTNTLIMAHDKGENNNLTFEQWLHEIIKVDKGMKLDCKELEAVAKALTFVKQRQDKIKGPIWANADILSGPGNKSVTVPADGFLKAVETFPAVTLSLGWTTVRKGNDTSLHYTMDHVKEMHDTCKDLAQQITFPVRAEQVLDSFESLDWLLQQSRKYTLTVWTAPGDNVTKADMDTFKRKFEMSRVYFDLPVDLRPSIP